MNSNNYIYTKKNSLNFVMRKRYNQNKYNQIGVPLDNYKNNNNNINYNNNNFSKTLTLNPNNIIISTDNISKMNKSEK